jgi:hypothetical protein
MNTTRYARSGHSPGAWLPRLLLTLCLGLWAAAGWAQTDPPGRVGRLADARGAVSWWDQETGRWAEAERNQPLTGGDRVSTAADASAELRVGSTVLRLGASSELEVLRLDDERLAFQLHSGSVALRVRSREIADELELVTAEVRLAPLGAGHFRLDRTDDTTHASSWRGDLRINDPAGFVITTGQRVELLRERRSNALRFQVGVSVNDRYAEAVQREDQRDERSVSARYVSPEMTGFEELDRSGRWEQHPEYGAVWLPQGVAAGWVPYSDGRWTWVQPWGWTWVDNARWGFAPFHYGRWAFWRSAWCWVPGAYVARPVYAPALVAWAGGRPGDGARVGVRITAPSVGWMPLAPREVYVPHHVVTPGYRERVNAGRERWGDRPQGPSRDGRDGRDERQGRDGRDNNDPRMGPDARNAHSPAPVAVPMPAPTPAPVRSPPPMQPPSGPVGPPVFRARPAVQPAPQAAPQAAPPAPAPPPAAVPKPTVEKPREPDRGRERERKPAGGDGARTSKDNESQK